MTGEKNFQTIRSMINRNATLYPDKIAMKEFETGKSCTFRELKDRTTRMGNAGSMNWVPKAARSTGSYNMEVTGI